MLLGAYVIHIGNSGPDGLLFLLLLIAYIALVVYGWKQYVKKVGIKEDEVHEIAKTEDRKLQPIALIIVMGVAYFLLLLILPDNYYLESMVAFSVLVAMVPEK